MPTERYMPTPEQIEENARIDEALRKAQDSALADMRSAPKEHTTTGAAYPSASAPAPSKS